MRKFIIVLFLQISFVNLAQKPPVKFGEISIEDLKMTRYDKDTAAAAVVLCDYGESAIVYNQSSGFELNFERLYRIKILTKDGLDYANFSIPLYHDGADTEKITGLKAVTYNLENDKIVESKMKNDGSFKEKVNANLDVTKITLPNVKQGSIVEISYKVNSDFLFNFQDWEFQSGIPIVWSEYRARIPQYFNYDKYMQGYLSLAVNEQTQVPQSIMLTSKERSGRYTSQTTFSTDKIEYQENRFRWVAKDVPAFKPEPYITTVRDYISKMNFELASTQFPGQPIKKYMGSWDDINKQFAESEDFGGAVSGNGFLKKTAEDLTAGLTTPLEKVAAIFNFVKSQIEWDGTSSRYLSKPLRKVLDEKKGNSAEVNLLTASILDKAGIKVYPVLISTRDHGFVREAIPISSQFNYVICMALVEDKPLLIDATEKLLPLGMVPERCLNGSGFLVSTQGYQWVKLQPAVKSRSVVNADLVLSSDGNLKGKLQIDRGGYDAVASRKKYFSKEEEEYVKDFLGNRPWEITHKEIGNAKDISQPMQEKYELVVNEHITEAGNTLYLNPMLLYRIENNPFKSESRAYPVDYSSPFEYVYMCRITLPPNCEVDEMPASKVIGLPGNAGRYTYSMTQTGRILNLVSNFQINKSLFAQTEYPALREFYGQVVAKQAEQIVLKKK